AIGGGYATDQPDVARSILRRQINFRAPAPADLRIEITDAGWQRITGHRGVAPVWNVEKIFVGDIDATAAVFVVGRVCVRRAQRNPPALDRQRGDIEFETVDGGFRGIDDDGCERWADHRRALHVFIIGVIDIGIYAQALIEPLRLDADFVVGDFLWFDL